MSANRVLTRFAHTTRVGVAILISLQFSFVGTLANAAPQDQEPAAQSPIKHVIIIVGENRTFDHIFATSASCPAHWRPIGCLQGQRHLLFV
jgi:phospholipase C